MTQPKIEYIKPRPETKFIIALNSSANGKAYEYANTEEEAKQIATKKAEEDQKIWHVTIAQVLICGVVLTS